MKLEDFQQVARNYTISQEQIDEKEQGRLSFIERFPIESIPQLTIEEYADTTTKDCFIYWLERKNILAGIGGGNSTKFGIYRAADGTYCKEYGSKKQVLEGEELETEFQALKQSIVRFIQLAKEDRIHEFRKNQTPLWNMCVLKILNIYFPEKFFNVYAPDVLIPLGKDLGVDKHLINAEQAVVLNYVINKRLRELDHFQDWHYEKLSSFIWGYYNDLINTNYWLIDTERHYQRNRFHDFIQQSLIGINVGPQELESVSSGDIDNIHQQIKERVKEENEQEALINFFRLQKGDQIAIKSTMSRSGENQESAMIVYAIGEIVENPMEGYQFSEQLGHTLPVHWLSTEERTLPGYGGYRKTIQKLIRKQNIKHIFGQQHSKISDRNMNNQGVDSGRVPNNIILYGPPGTGKTYNVMNKALEVMGAEFEDILSTDNREMIVQEFNRLVQEGRIHMTTFHPSYSYEDFIEGLKSDGKGGFIPKDGVFKEAAMNAAYDGLRLERNDDQEVNEHLFNRLYDFLVEHGIEQQITFTSITGKDNYISEITPEGNLAITNDQSSLSSRVSKRRLLKLYRYVVKNQIDIHQGTSFIKEAIGGCNVTRFWSVLHWIMNKIEEEKLSSEVEELSGETTQDSDYKKQQVLAHLLEQKDFDFSKADRHVFIIDEINRGNISKIFGELITLLEEDKRLGQRNQSVVKLPYSNEHFTLPPNLTIIGTMNTADRSISLLDSALRRRFEFEEIMPQPELLQPVGDIDLSSMLEMMNKRISVLYDRDHTIGHAYLIHVDTEEELIHVFKNKIIQLLQEYFYDDWEKIGLVLGGIGSSEEDPFIVYQEKIDMSKLFKHAEVPAYEAAPQYKIKKHLTTKDFLTIYE